MVKNVIIGTGSYLPEKILTNDDLSKMVETSDEWITERTGIKQRHIAAENELTSDLASKAAQNTLNSANTSSEDIDLIVIATTTPDNTFPATAVSVQRKIGANKAVAFDVQAVCSGFIYALNVADSLMKTNGYQKALVIGAETMSRVLDWNDRGTCILFGDGAGAIVLESKENTDRGILSHTIHSDGREEELLYTTGGVSKNQSSGTIIMSGSEVFKHAVTKLAKCTIESLDKINADKEDVDWIIPHQANQRILDATIKKLRAPQEKLISTVAKHANTSAASIPLAIDDAAKVGKLKEGDLLALQAIGGGLTWGSCIIRY